MIELLADSGPFRAGLLAASAAIAKSEIRQRQPAQDAGVTVCLPGKPLGRNDPCPCGGGKKYKRCHGVDKYFRLR